MADFKTPNLCGANETLNDALSKIKNLKDEILAQSTALPSVKKAAFESKLTELKSSLDGLAVDLPESKPVNLQSEITSLINDVDRKTAQGIAAFNAKVAALKKDFGGALEKKGLDFDKLIDEVEPGNLRLPVLIKKYIKQNARVIAFNVDPLFNNAVDGLMYIKISDLPESTVKPVMEEFQADLERKLAAGVPPEEINLDLP